MTLIAEPQSRFNLFAYHAYCVRAGWGIPYSGRDWSEDRLTPTEKQALINLHDELHSSNWQPRESVEIDPFAVIERSSYGVPRASRK